LCFLVQEVFASSRFLDIAQHVETETDFSLGVVYRALSSE
jgi:hypothetical protein